MLNGIISYIRSWFPASSPFEESRKRRAAEPLHLYNSPKYRKIISPEMTDIDEDVFLTPRPRRSLNSTLQPIVIDSDEDNSGQINKSINSNKKPKTRKSFEAVPKLNGHNDDIREIKPVKSATERKWDSKNSSFSYITRFTSDLEPITTQISNNNGAKPKQRTTPNRNKTTGRLNRSYFSSPSLNDSFRLEDKWKYKEMLDNIAVNGSQDSIYVNPLDRLGSFNVSNRTRKLVELTKARTPKRTEVIDLTNESKNKLSTKDTVIRILDDFKDEPTVIEDSDSDVEILPTPPSPKPDIKVDPINSLKTVIDTSKVAHRNWLDEITKKHERFVEDKSKEVERYAENSSALNEINRDILIKTLARKVHDSLAIREGILPIEEEEEEIELPPLTDEQLRMVKKAFSGDPNEILTKKFNLNVNKRDIQTLAGLNWLNDNVINFYMNLIIERGENSDKWPKSYAMNTFFYQKLLTSGPESLRRWTRKIDLFSYELICVPIHLGIHWCMAIINLKEKTIKYYDSMGKPNNRCLNALREYLECEHKDKKGVPYDTKDFVLESAQDIPQQMNGSDCGVFSCTFAEFASRRAKFTFHQEDMPYLRKKMVVEIITGQLLIQ